MTSWRLLESFTRQLELSSVDEHSRVVVVADNTTTASIVETTRLALERLGVIALEIHPRGRATVTELVIDGTANGIAGPAFDADLIIDCTHGGDVYGASRTNTSSDHIAVLHIDPIAASGRYLPHTALRQRVDQLSHHCSSGDRMTLTDEHGTDLSFLLANAFVQATHGLIGDNEPRARFPAGSVRVQPTEFEANGSLVVMPGDGNLSTGTHFAAPVRISFEDDQITNIESNGSDADLLRALLEQADSPLGYRSPSINIGMHAGPGLVAKPFDPVLRNSQSARVQAGVVTVAVGPPGLAPLPVQLALAGRSVMIGELPILDAGMLQGSFGPDAYETASTKSE